MKKENQSDSDERIRLLNKQRAEIQDEVAQLTKEIKQNLKEVSELQKEGRKDMKEIRRRFKETSKQIKEVSESQKDTDKQIKETGKQIGGLGNKFGGYTEAMARPSIRRLLKERFNADYLGPIRYKNSEEMGTLEIDAWGLSRNGTGTVYLVEVKSKFRDEHIEQVLQQVERFRYYQADYGEQAVYPMLAVVEISQEERRKVWDAGIHLIDVNDGVFKYAKPPEDFEANGHHGAFGVQKGVPHLQLVIGGNNRKRGTG